MKVFILYIAIFAVALLFIPMIALGFRVEAPADERVETHAPVMPQPGASEPPLYPTVDEPVGPDILADNQPDAPEGPDAPFTEKGVDAFLILDESSGNLMEVELRDYVRGAVAAEMPASFHIEALKAQAVAAHTFALHNHLAQRENPDPALQGADFAADPSNLRVFLTEAQVREFYGDQFEENWAKICEAADSALPYVLEYDGEPIVAAYHAISGGTTEDASNVWEGDAPYLQAADSEGDLLAPHYESVVEVGVDEMRDRLTGAFPAIQLGEDPAEWFGDPTRSGSGYVLEQPVGDLAVHGAEVRQLLGLRSHNYDLDYRDGGFTFTVYGYGHGVGLSQYGADFLARQGRTFDQILENYYGGAQLKQVSIAENAN